MNGLLSAQERRGRAVPFHLSGSGVGMSVGVRGMRVGTGPHGNYVRIGRGGVYYQQTFHTPTPTPTPTRVVPSPPNTGGTHAPLQEIASASAAQIADSSSEQLLAELREKRTATALMPFASRRIDSRSAVRGRASGMGVVAARHRGYVHDRCGAPPRRAAQNDGDP